MVPLRVVTPSRVPTEEEGGYPAPGRRAGFTLTELLVVMAILALLAALLFPVLASVRERARTAVCLSNLHLIGLANLMYVQDYDEQFPFAGRDWPQASFIDVWNGLAPYLPSPGVFLCPSDSRPAWNQRWALQRDPALLGELRVPSSYHYLYAFYHDFSDREQAAGRAGPPVSMPAAAVLYPTQKAIFVCFARNWAQPSQQITLCLVDGHSRLVSLSQLNAPVPPQYGRYNLDWTVGGLAGKDLNE